MGKCHFKPGSIQVLFELSYLPRYSYRLEELENCGNFVLVSGENRRNPPGNHKRRGYCFWSTFKVICHFHLVAILDFEERKMETNFFSILMYQKYKIKSKIAFNRRISRKIQCPTPSDKYIIMKHYLP